MRNCLLLRHLSHRSAPGADWKFLHIYHKNGHKNDCRPENLEILCIRCHGEEPMHGNMKGLAHYNEFLRIFAGFKDSRPFHP